LGNDFSGKAEEKIGKAEDFFSLFFIPPCLGKHFSGKRKENSTHRLQNFIGQKEAPRESDSRGAWGFRA